MYALIHSYTLVYLYLPIPYHNAGTNAAQPNRTFV
jgi:hypothetical protein